MKTFQYKLILVGILLVFAGQTQMFGMQVKQRKKEAFQKRLKEAQANIMEQKNLIATKFMKDSSIADFELYKQRDKSAKSSVRLGDKFFDDLKAKVVQAADKKMKNMKQNAEKKALQQVKGDIAKIKDATTIAELEKIYDDIEEKLANLTRFMSIIEAENLANEKLEIPFKKQIVNVLEKYKKDIPLKKQKYLKKIQEAKTKQKVTYQKNLWNDYSDKMRIDIEPIEMSFGENVTKIDQLLNAANTEIDRAADDALGAQLDAYEKEQIIRTNIIADLLGQASKTNLPLGELEDIGKLGKEDLYKPTKTYYHAAFQHKRASGAMKNIKTPSKNVNASKGALEKIKKAWEKIKLRKDLVKNLKEKLLEIYNAQKTKASKISFENSKELIAPLENLDREQALRFNELRTVARLSRVFEKETTTWLLTQNPEADEFLDILKNFHIANYKKLNDSLQKLENKANLGGMQKQEAAELKKLWGEKLDYGFGVYLNNLQMLASKKMDNIGAKIKAELGQKGKLTDVQKNEIKTMLQGLINVLQNSSIAIAQTTAKNLENAKEKVLESVESFEKLDQEKKQKVLEQVLFEVKEEKEEEMDPMLRLHFMQKQDPTIKYPTPPSAPEYEEPEIPEEKGLVDPGAQERAQKLILEELD